MYCNKVPWKYRWMDGWILWKVEFIKFSLGKLDFESWNLRWFFVVLVVVVFKLARKINLTPFHLWLKAWFCSIQLVGFLLYFHSVPEVCVFPLCAWSSGWPVAAELEFREGKYNTNSSSSAPWFWGQDFLIRTFSEPSWFKEMSPFIWVYFCIKEQKLKAK